MASSSASSEARSIVSAKLYDVFISHRGSDDKQTLIAKQLCDILQGSGCKPFLDREEIEGGDSITSAIHNAICSSRVQIAIFSKGFAESSWCLDELVLMLHQTNALFIPVFYGVQPWELRHIDNDKSQYAKAFAEYQSKGRNLDKLDGWKRALASAADISGYQLGHHQEDLCERIVSRVVQVVQDQLDALLPEAMLGSVSLVIITTRDQSMLRGVDVRYKMKGMDRSHAKDLFCSHAFCRRDPPTSYEELVESFVEFCGGLPLSLVVLGAHVYKRELNYWKLELEKVKKIQPRDIEKRLKISFDGLDREEKQIFIDIACFFNKKYDYFKRKDQATKIWKACGWSAEHALQTLQDKCLIEINRWARNTFEMSQEFFEMHDHLRDLGRKMADEIGPPRLWQPELLRSMEAKGFKQTLTEAKGRCFHYFWDSSLGRKITYVIADTDLVFLDIWRANFLELCNIPSWIPLWKLRYLSICGVADLCSSFEKQLEGNAQATFELRRLYIWSSPFLQKVPNIIEMFSHLEELKIGRSLEKTDTTSFVQSLKQLSNLRSLNLRDTEGGLFRGFLDLSKGRDSCRSSRMDSLETIQLYSLQNIFKLVISEEMCPKLETLSIYSMKNLKEIELKQPERLNTLRVHDCRKLETISGLKVVDRSRLEHISIRGCPELQSVQGLEELPRLESLLIEVPHNRKAEWAGDYVRGLKVTETLSKLLNPSLFFEVIDVEEVSQIDTLEMKSSSSAITIYALLVESNSWVTINFESREDYWFNCGGDLLITVVLTQHDGECRLECKRIIKGFKVIVNFGEEDKALIVLRKIVDQLYMERTKPKSAAYDVLKRKRMLE